MAHSRSVVEALDGIRNVLDHKTAHESKAVIEALDRIRDALERQLADESKSVFEAIDGIREGLAPPSADALPASSANAIAPPRTHEEAESQGARQPKAAARRRRGPGSRAR
jgi:hypothetical protein